MIATPGTKRDALTQLFDAGRVVGVAYLFALIALGRVTVQELADLSGDERHRIGRFMRRLESRGFVIRVQHGHGEMWNPTPKALALFGAPPVALSANLLVDFLPANPSSSSDQIKDQSVFSDQSEEEEASRHKIYLLKKHNISGPKAAQLAADPWVTPLRLTAWLLQIGEMKRSGFKFRKSPEAYAISCLLRHDEANQRAYHDAQRALELDLRYMPRDDDDYDNEDDEEA